MRDQIQSEGTIKKKSEAKVEQINSASAIWKSQKRIKRRRLP
jgi:HSP90 family molecular chaperone